MRILLHTARNRRRCRPHGEKPSGLAIVNLRTRRMRIVSAMLSADGGTMNIRIVPAPEPWLER